MEKDELPTIMKFILVNHRKPCGPSTCIECRRSLGAGYLRDMSTQRPYCDYDCYLRYRAKSLFVPWLAVSPGDHLLAPNYGKHLAIVTLFAAASCWYSIVIAKAALRLSELMTDETFNTNPQIDQPI
ncbi:hypothetical protein [Bradyrhizobium sp. USDA 10063]